MLKAGRPLALACSVLLLLAARSSSAQQTAGQSLTQQAASSHQLQGKILQERDIPLKGTDQTNKVVLIENNQGQRIAVDLGPSADLKNVPLNKGDSVTVNGEVVNVAGKPVFMASQINEQGRQVPVNRQLPQLHPGEQAAQPSQQEPQQFSGQIEKIKQVPMKGSLEQHNVAILKLDDGKRMHVDLGPVSQLASANLKEGSRVTVQGSETTIQDHPILLAQQVTADNRTYQIQLKPVSPQQVNQPQTSPPQENILPQQQHMTPQQRQPGAR